MKNLPWKLLLGAVTIATIFDFLIYKTNNIGINLLLIQLTIISVTIFLTLHTKHKVPTGSWIAATFATAFAATFAIWTSEIGLILSGFGLFFSNGFFAFFTLGHRGKFHHPIHIITDGITYILKTVFTRIQIIGHFKAPSFSDGNSAILRGVLITIPVLIIFSALFLGSDLILQEKASSLTNWLNEFMGANDIVAHVFIIGFFTSLFLLFFSAAFWKRFEPNFIKQLESKMNVESLIVLLGSSFVFLAFLIFQGFYLFGGQSAWDTIEGITYSEYAVQGFNELAVVSLLVIGLILTLRIVHAENAKNKFVLILETALLSETVLILISAWIRLKLYVTEYGFTPARLFGFWFFIVMIALLTMLAINILRKKAQYKFLQQSIIFVGCMMLIFTILAPDALSIRLNLARAEDQFDPFPLFYELSAEAYPLMHHVLTSEKYNIGLMDTTIKDYCPFVMAHYSYGRNQEIPNRIVNFTLVDHYEIDENLQHDFWLRRSIARFENRWNKKHFKRNPEYYEDPERNPLFIPDTDWREFNASRAQLPKSDKYNEIVVHGIPFPADKVANACGQYIGDLR